MSGSKRSFFKKSAGLTNVINPFDLVDASSDDNLDNAHTLPADMVVSLKKAGKKDLTSKLKALEELQEMTQNPQYGEHIQSVGFAKNFIKVFAKLSVDPERRVREAAFAWLQKICEEPTRRRCLNYVITDLSFYWLGAIYDPVSSVFSLAKRCLESSFNSTEKMKLFVETISVPCRQMIKETIEFRAEEAREVALADVDTRENADYCRALHLIRAVSCEAFLGRYFKSEEMCELIMKMIDDQPEKSIHLWSHSLYYYGMTIRLTDAQFNLLIKLGLTDTSHGDLVLDLVLCKHYSHINIALLELIPFCKSAISALPRQVISKIALLLQRVDESRCRDEFVTSLACKPNTLDVNKLKAIIEELFPIVHDDTVKTNMFNMVIVDRQSPWTNLDLMTALEALRVAMGDEFMDRQLKECHGIDSVPLLVFKSHRDGNIDALCESLSDLLLSVKDLTIILSDQELIKNSTVIETVFDSFTKALGQSQLYQFIPLFDIHRLLDKCEPKPVLQWMSQNADGDAPWCKALALCKEEELNNVLVVRMLAVCEYSTVLMSALESIDTRLQYSPGRLSCNVNESWLSKPRFAEWLISRGNVEMVPVGLVRLLSTPVQLQFLQDCPAPVKFSDYIDEVEFTTFCQSICKSFVCFKRTKFPSLSSVDVHDRPIEDQVLLVLLDNSIHDLAEHVIVYLMWREDNEEDCDYGELIGKLIPSVSVDELQMCSRTYGGYYSHLLGVMKETISTDTISSMDTSLHLHHQIIYWRQQPFDAVLDSVTDSTTLLSIMCPRASGLDYDSVKRMLELSDYDDRLMAEFMAALNHSMIQQHSDIKTIMSSFLSTHKLTISACILARHCDLIMSDTVLTCQYGREVLELLFEGSLDPDVLMIVRQLAPFMLTDLIINHVIVIAGEKSWRRKRTARYLFNLLHDNILTRLQAKQDNVLPAKFYTPFSLDSFELVIGLIEACGEEDNMTAHCLQSKIILDDRLIDSILVTLKWNTTTPIDLCKCEFTMIDWDHCNQDHLLAANVLFRGWRVLTVPLRVAFATRQETRQYMSEYISPMIIQRELEKCKRFSRNNKNDPLQIKVLSSSTLCQLAAEYTLEEDKLSVLIDIPADFPLSVVQVDCKSGRKGLPQGKWKAALLSCTTILTTRCSLLSALQSWSQNLLSLFSGMEPCSICYSVLHPQERTLPTPACGTCGNKFHAQCLYKWFRTGGQATCPMCRGIW